jgi:hypothetical protein
MTNLSSLLWRLVALLAAIVVLFAPARALDDEIVSEFKKYFKQYKDTATRIEAVLSLEGTESPAVVDALLPILKMVEDPDVVRAGVRVLSKFKTDEPKAALFAAIEAQKDEAVRSGLLQAAAAGKYTGANEALKKVLVDKSWDLRRRAIDALVASGDTTVVDAIAPLCADAEPAVRCAALEGLAALKSELVLKPAIDNARARGVAGARERDPGAQEGAPPRLDRSADRAPFGRRGAPAADVGDALNEITGRSFGTRLELWQQFWEAYKDRFQIPTDAELAKLRAKQKEEAAKYKPEKSGRPATTASRRPAGASCS